LPRLGRLMDASEVVVFRQHTSSRFLDSERIRPSIPADDKHVAHFPPRTRRDPNLANSNVPPATYRESDCELIKISGRFPGVGKSTGHTRGSCPTRSTQKNPDSQFGFCFCAGSQEDSTPAGVSAISRGLRPPVADDTPGRATRNRPHPGGVPAWGTDLAGSHFEINADFSPRTPGMKM
jgi:hypothetical protein